MLHVWSHYATSLHGSAWRHHWDFQLNLNDGGMFTTANWFMEGQKASKNRTVEEVVVFNKGGYRAHKQTWLLVIADRRLTYFFEDRRSQKGERRDVCSHLASREHLTWWKAARKLLTAMVFAETWCTNEKHEACAHCGPHWRFKGNESPKPTTWKAWDTDKSAKNAKSIQVLQVRPFFASMHRNSAILSSLTLT